MKNVENTAMACAVNKGQNVNYNGVARFQLAYLCWKELTEKIWACKCGELFPKAIAHLQQWQAHDPENLVQQAFAILSSRPMPKNDDEFNRNFFEILRGKRIDAHRQLEVRERLEPKVQVEIEVREKSSFHVVEQNELRGILQRGMERLPANQRNSLYLSFFENLSILEIAARLRRRESTVKSDIHRAKKQLLIFLNELGGVEAFRP